MLSREELKGRKITEISAILGGIRVRVYRGRQPDHIAWKLEEHKNRNPEVLELDPPDGLDSSS